ncbi:MAG: ribosome maturation factor RimM [Bacteroidetes bacterium]|jgi:16S rRNA processing protein RimM|nr:ribosome maturation factor RimM [Bacteroidota bacterium]MDA0973659.1 ribosome maturation factor RimM [Bacteroidota bacterium]
MSETIRIGKVARLHGFKGEVSLKVDNEFMASLQDTDMLFLELEQKQVPFFIEQIKFTKTGFALVRFEGVETEAAAQRLMQCSVYLRDEDLDAEDRAEMEANQLEGYQVHDEVYGDIGEVIELVIHPGNSFLIVDHPSGEVIIPYNDEFILEIDDEKMLITCKTPEGLIELNLEG